MHALSSRFARAGRLAAILAALIGAVSGAGAQETEIRLSRRADKAYELSGQFAVNASSSVVWDVLTDYDHIPAFVTSMRSSRVQETREDGSVLVEQKAVGGMFLLSKSVRILLEVRRSPDMLRFTDVGLKDFSVYSGSWETQRTPEGLLVTYHLLARPHFLAPSFIMGGAMKRGARDLLDQVRAEIVRRSS